MMDSWKSMLVACRVSFHILLVRTGSYYMGRTLADISLLTWIAGTFIRAIGLLYGTKAGYLPCF
jgi:hypothetical protein